MEPHFPLNRGGLIGGTRYDIPLKYTWKKYTSTVVSSTFLEGYDTESFSGWNVYFNSTTGSNTTYHATGFNGSKTTTYNGPWTSITITQSNYESWLNKYLALSNKATSSMRKPTRITSFDADAQRVIYGGTYYHRKRNTVYERGDYIEDVYASTSTKYPSNGRHTDGYWYVLQ